MLAWVLNLGFAASGVSVAAGPPVEPVGVALLDPVPVKGGAGVDGALVGAQASLPVVPPKGTGRVDRI